MSAIGRRRLAGRWRLCRDSVLECDEEVRGGLLVWPRKKAHRLGQRARNFTLLFCAIFRAFTRKSSRNDRDKFSTFGE
jgi:hypothetical protein